MGHSEEQAQDPRNDSVTQDKRGVPETEWKERLQKALNDLEMAARAMAT